MRFTFALFAAAPNQADLPDMEISVRSILSFASLLARSVSANVPYEADLYISA